MTSWNLPTLWYKDTRSKPKPQYRNGCLISDTWILKIKWKTEPDTTICVDSSANSKHMLWFSMYIESGDNKWCPWYQHLLHMFVLFICIDRVHPMSHDIWSHVTWHLVTWLLAYNVDNVELEQIVIAKLAIVGNKKGHQWEYAINTLTIGLLLNKLLLLCTKINRQWAETHLEIFPKLREQHVN